MTVGELKKILDKMFDDDIVTINVPQIDGFLQLIGYDIEEAILITEDDPDLE